MSWQQLAVAGLWGGLLAVERRAFLQAMFSRPLVAATGLGYLLGDVTSGLAVGLVLELFYLGGAALGASLPDHDTLAGTAVAAAAVALGQALPDLAAMARWSLALLLFVWTGRAGRWADRRLDRYTARLAAQAHASAQVGDLRRAMRQNLWGMWPHLVAFGLATAACGAAAGLLAPAFERLPQGLVRGLTWAYPAMASVAAGCAARGSRARRAGVLAASAAGVAAAGTAAWWWWTRGAA